MATRTSRVQETSAGTPAEAAFRALLRTGGLMRAVMQPYFQRFGISGSQWGVLRALRRAEVDGRQGLRLTDLSQRLLVQPPSTTGAVDRLQRMGLVARTIASDDARARQVRLTPAGRKIVERVLQGHGRQVRTVMAGLSEQQLTQLTQLMERLGLHLEELVE
jgi:DNA-binding MarR family transcriptional regulator